jgi:hypothetical protein
MGKLSPNSGRAFHHPNLTLGILRILPRLVKEESKNKSAFFQETAITAKKAGIFFAFFSIILVDESGIAHN